MKRNKIVISLSVLLISVSSVFAEEGQKQEGAVLVPFLYDDHGKRDPLWPLVTSMGAVMSYDTDFMITDLSLEGIVFGTSETSLAIINGRVLKINEKIGQYVITDIQPNSITISIDGQNFELKLKKEE